MNMVNFCDETDEPKLVGGPLKLPLATSLRDSF